MLRQTIDILSSFQRPVKRCVMGNVAIARAAIESGVEGVFSYPGTPSTEISEVFSYVDRFQRENSGNVKYKAQTSSPVYFEYSINEKIALEKAIAFTIGHRSAMCVMKNVGMNVACDALMSITYQVINAPLVIVIADDPGCHSSSNEQDSRYWGKMASVPVFDPSSPEEALKMTRDAFRLSAAIGLPVIVRTTTRVSHSRGVVTYGKIFGHRNKARFERVPENINIPARTAAAHARLLEKLKLPAIGKSHRSFCRTSPKTNNSGMGILCSGVSVLYVNELLHRHGLEKTISVFIPGLINPFPEKEALKWLKTCRKILVLEELDPLLETATRCIVQQNKLKTEIYGKGFSEITSTGEFSVDIIREVLVKFMGKKFFPEAKKPVKGIEKYLAALPPRPPALCAGCPHRATFYMLKLAIPREQSDLYMCGDIGCFGLGALPPLKMIDTINHMGMSISMAQGLYEAFRSGSSERKVVALLGDGTFFHSGLNALVNAVYTKANVLVVIFDNRTIGMTGHQPHPGASRESKYHEIEIPPLLNGLGIEVVETLDPFDLPVGFEKLNKAMTHKGVSVIVAKSPCIFLPDFKESMAGKRKITVDPTRCNSCENHEDISLSCSRKYSPLNNLSRARTKMLAKSSVGGDDLLCPANICNHGFFHSILEGDNRAAIEIVRDKMLFSRTCGDICHRPCELFSTERHPVPIKALKKYISAADVNFRDFSAPISRARKAERKNKKIAVIGGGPAGLSAAYDLVQAGYKVEVFEKEEKAGGMVMYAIPGFRMDKNGFSYEAMQLKKMGVKFHFGKILRGHGEIEELAAGFDAVVLAIGMGKAKSMDWAEKNIPAGKLIPGLEFLKQYNQGTLKGSTQASWLVIGGGNSAMDVARTARHLGPGNRVQVSCLETKEKMPAFREEVEHAEGEGVEFIHDSIPCECIVSSSGKLRITLQIHASGEQKIVEVDAVITSIGQAADMEMFIGVEGVKIDQEGRVHSETAAGSFGNIFFAGDVVSGNSMSVIGAIASGKDAAVRVRKLLENYGYEYEGKKALDRLNASNTPVYRPFKAGMILVPDSTDEKPAGMEFYDICQACQKCNHCMDNFGCPAMIKVNGKVEIDQSRCTRCGLCIDVCPNNAIRWESEKVKNMELVL